MSTLANGLDVSNEAREALIPGSVGTGISKKGSKYRAGIPRAAAAEAASNINDGTALIKGEVDEEAMLAASTFPIKPPELIARAKEVLEGGVGTRDGGKDLAPDFEFCAAVVGPLGREEYLKALATFKLEEAFPDINPQYYGFRVDPFQPYRVWFHSRSMATHTGPLLGKPPTGKQLALPPQLFHLDFNEQGLVREIGFYVVDRRQGNTGGLGGAFGYFYGTGNGLPIPECKPYRRSWQFKLLNMAARMRSRFSKK